MLEEGYCRSHAPKTVGSAVEEEEEEGGGKEDEKKEKKEQKIFVVLHVVVCVGMNVHSCSELCVYEWHAVLHCSITS
jgi:hypothetical protein